MHTEFQRPTSFEVLGQCSLCKDLFSVFVYRLRDRYYADETSRLKQLSRNGEDLLIHRPGFCNGKVSLYGSIE
jgi:hypothetical protein